MTIRDTYLDSVLKNNLGLLWWLFPTGCPKNLSFFGTPCTYTQFLNFPHDPHNKTKHLGTKNCSYSLKSPVFVGHPLQFFFQLKLFKHLKLIPSMSVNKIHKGLTWSTELCPKYNQKHFPHSKLAAIFQISQNLISLY